MIEINKELISALVALSKDIEVLELDTRAYTALRRRGIRKVWELCEAYNDGVLPKVRNIGQKSLYEIEWKLKEYLDKTGVTS